jgi:hypothetical protein
MIFHEIPEIKCEEGVIIKVKVLPSGLIDTVTCDTSIDYPLVSMSSSDESYEMHGFKYRYELQRTTEQGRLEAYVKYLITNNICRIIII